MANDAAIKLYRTSCAKYAKGANVEGRLPRVRHGGRASTTVESLKARRQEPHPRRPHARRSKLTSRRNPFLLPGITLKTGAGDRFPIEQVLLQRWQKGGWKVFGGLWGYRAALDLPVEPGRSERASRPQPFARELRSS